MDLLPETDLDQTLRMLVEAELRPLPVPGPMAQGDLTICPVVVAGPVQGAPVTATGVTLIRSRWWAPRHRITSATPGVRWLPIHRLTRGRAGLLGLLTVPAGGHAVVEHTGQEHGPLSVPGGPAGTTWQVTRQRREHTGSVIPMLVLAPLAAID